MPQQATIDPTTGERVSQSVAIDPATGERVTGQHDPINYNKLSTAAITSHMTGIPPSVAYDNHDQVAKEFAKHGVDAPIPATISNDIKVGAEDSVFGLAYRDKMPQVLQSPSRMDSFISGLSRMVADLPVYYAGGMMGTFLGGVAGNAPGAVGGGAIGAFAIPEAIRKSLTLGIEKGDIKSFSDLMDRTLETFKAAEKGALLGLVTHGAGKGTIPLPKSLGKAGSAVGAALKNQQQSAVLTILSALSEGHAPTAGDFVTNSALIGTLGLAMHGVSGKQAAMDVYAKDGTHPEEMATRLQAQPTVKDTPKPGLQTAIKLADGTVTGENESHDDLAERATGQRPVGMDALESDPKLADKVLANPEIHDQSVIDRAYAMKQEQPTEREQKVADYLDKLLNDRARSDAVKDRMDDLEESGANPRSIMQEFWDKTFPSLDEKGQKQFLKQFKFQMGMEPGSTLAVGPSGNVVANDWRDITDVFFKDSSKFSDIEQNEQAVTALAHMLNEKRPELAGKGLESGSVIKGESGAVSKDLQLPPAEPLPPKPTSGRGFASTSGDYMSLMAAKNWTKANEPEVHDVLQQVNGDPKTELHAKDYQEAHSRVNARSLAEGDSKFGIVDEVAQFQAKNRSTLNDIKAGDVSKGYGNQVVRSTFDGPRKLVRSFGQQVEGHIRKLIPDSNYVEQEALGFMRDYRDDPEALRQQIEEIRNSDNEQLKHAIPSMERALDPTPAMVQADKLMTDAFTQANDLRRQYVGADSTIDPARYSPRNFMLAEQEEGQSGVGGGKFAKRSGHDIGREYLHRLDPLMSGDVKARTFNAVDELGVYFDKLATNVGRSVFESEIINSELGKSGNISKVPANWVDLTGMSHTLIKTDPTTGKVTYIKQGFKVHPKVADAMKPLLSGDELSGNSYFRGAKVMQGWVKGMELGLSVFHMRALSISFMNNAGLDAYREAMLSDNNSPEFEAQERLWATHGLETTKTSRPYEAYRGLNASSIESRSALLEKLRQGYEPLDTAFKATTKATFEVVQRKFKVIDASTRGAAWVANHPQATDAETMKAMRGIAKEVNAVYGGLNWDVMGVNPTLQSMSRLFFLAPDWTFSNVANLKYAGTGGPGGNAARAFWARSFITGIALNSAASLFFTGKLQDKDHWYEVSLGDDANGHAMYTNPFFAGAPKDAITTYNLTMKHGFPRGIILAGVNKAGPIASTLSRMAMNMDWEGKPIEGRKGDFIDKTLAEGKFAGGNLTPVPFTFGALAQRMLEPDKDITYKDFLFSIAAGAPVTHEGEGKKPSKTVLKKSPIRAGRR